MQKLISLPLWIILPLVMVFLFFPSFNGWRTTGGDKAPPRASRSRLKYELENKYYMGDHWFELGDARPESVCVASPRPSLAGLAGMKKVQDVAALFADINDTELKERLRSRWGNLLATGSGGEGRPISGASRV